MLDLVDTEGRGLEIGPLHEPIATKDRHDVRYVDVFDTATLHRQYALDPNVDVADIVDVDFAIGTQSLSEAVMVDAPYDWVIASHVIEHTADLIGWLGSLADVMADRGQLFLAVPDRRYTFDALRPETTMGQLIDERGRTTPSLRAVYDHYRSMVSISTVELWAGADPRLAPRVFSWDEVNERCREAQSGVQMSTHVWVFSRDSFLEQIEELRLLGLCDFTVEVAGPTLENDCEFFVIMRRNPRQ